MERERLDPLGFERAREQRVVAVLRVGVEREVIRGERDFVLEEDLQAVLERRLDRRHARAPEQPVVDDQQIRVLCRGELEQLGVGRDAAREGRDRAGPGTCRPLTQ